jgi:hypothetical protein
MTEEQMQTLIAIGDQLRAMPLAWDQIPEQHKQIIINIMRPAPTFTAEQRSFLNRWWMQVDDEKVAELNGKLRRNSRIWPRVDGDGNKWISADLVTDAAEPRLRLHAILPELLGLTLVYHEESYWPVPDDEPL